MNEIGAARVAGCGVVVDDQDSHRDHLLLCLFDRDAADHRQRVDVERGSVGGRRLRVVGLVVQAAEDRVLRTRGCPLRG